jgi:hypothetical protein
MVVKVSTTFDTTTEKLWEKIVNPKVLQRVAFPLLTFTPKQGSDFSQPWSENTTYDVSLHFFGCIPMGSHRIRLTEMNRKTNEIHSTESGSLAKTWNHIIRFNRKGNQVEYSDEVEIKAGIMTFPIWLFANFFYRHRQRKWKMILSV